MRNGRRRSGISNLVGALFFVLIVALALSILTVMFTVSSGYIGGIHSTNQQEVQAAATNIAVTGVTFGGVMEKTPAPGVLIGVNTSDPLPLLPIANMNFSQGLQGWYVSKDYPTLVDSATAVNGDNVTSVPPNGSDYIEQSTLSATQSSNEESFTLTVTNTAALGSGDFIDKISLLVDTYFNNVGGGTCAVGCPGWHAPTINGNNITMSVAPLVGGIPPQETASWTWTADVPDTAGNYYHTIVLYWWHTQPAPFPPKYLDYGTVTAETIITTPLPFPNPAAPMLTLNARTPGITPGGLTAGYDSNAIMTTLASGPGSLYATFEPTFGGNQLPSGQQLSAGLTFSYAFSLTETQTSQLSGTAAATVAASLDEANTVPNPLLYYELVLVNPSGTPFVINPGGTDPTTVNHFGATGWIQKTMQLQPAAGFWVRGTYEFELVVNMTIPSGTPSQISVHFDNLGLALNLSTPPAGGSAYGSKTFTIAFPGLTAGGAVDYNQVENLDLGVNMSLSSNPGQSLSGTSAYVYIAENTISVLSEASAQVWYQVGSINFNGSASDNVAIPLANVASFISTNAGEGQITVKVVLVFPNGGTACPTPAGPPSTCTLSVTAYSIAQWENTHQAAGQAVVAITNGEGASSIQLVSLYLSGDNGTLPANPLVGSTNGVARFTIDNWVNAGSTVLINLNLASENFAWVPGQVYQVTVLSEQGVSYSASFTAP